MRTLFVGPGIFYPSSHAFPRAPVTQTVGWCWTGNTGNYQLYAVANGYGPVYVEGLAGKYQNKVPAPGPAAIP